jgi:hypothetical protein
MMSSRPQSDSDSTLRVLGIGALDEPATTVILTTDFAYSFYGTDGMWRFL